MSYKKRGRRKDLQAKQESIKKEQQFQNEEDMTLCELVGIDLNKSLAKLLEQNDIIFPQSKIEEATVAHQKFHESPPFL